MSINSYAQNFEDVMLWRALGHIENGTYIDIGAQDPIVDSVSLAFYERGWSGVHIEPSPHYAQLLRQHRSGDRVIQAAVGGSSELILFYNIPNSGISTANIEIALKHKSSGFNIQEIIVPNITLKILFESLTPKNTEIHWLKIDVEGFEAQVISSWGSAKTRPWIVVIESTLPLTQIESNLSWEQMLLGYGYSQVYFDGLNRYYVSNLHHELKSAFKSPPNVFDNFTINGTASNTMHRLIDQRHRLEADALTANHKNQIKLMEVEITELRTSLKSLKKIFLSYVTETSTNSNTILTSKTPRLAAQEADKESAKNIVKKNQAQSNKKTNT